MTGRFDKLLHAQRPTTAQGHMHKEAFCLMWYGCRACGHRERIWNSRDGVTPFCTLCPSCNHPELQHVDWGLDIYAPSHTPAIGQRVWVSMTRERAEAIARRRIKAHGLADEGQRSLRAHRRVHPERWASASLGRARVRGDRGAMTIATREKVLAAVQRAVQLGASQAEAIDSAAQALCLPVEAVDECLTTEPVHPPTPEIISSRVRPVARCGSLPSAPPR